MRHGWIASLSENFKSHPIEADQAIFCPEPEKLIVVLREAKNSVLGQTLLRLPGFVNELAEPPVRLESKALDKNPQKKCDPQSTCGDTRDP